MSDLRREYAAVAVGGALGALARAAVLEVWPERPGWFPWSIFGVNVLGAAVLALVLVWGERSLTTHRHWHHLWRPFMTTGVLGGFTTTSAFAVLSVELVSSGQPATALAFVLGSVAAAALAHSAAHALALRLLRRAEAA